MPIWYGDNHESTIYIVTTAATSGTTASAAAATAITTTITAITSVYVTSINTNSATTIFIIANTTKDIDM